MRHRTQSRQNQSDDRTQNDRCKTDERKEEEETTEPEKEQSGNGNAEPKAYNGSNNPVSNRSAPVGRLPGQSSDLLFYTRLFWSFRGNTRQASEIVDKILSVHPRRPIRQPTLGRRTLHRILRHKRCTWSLQRSGPSSLCIPVCIGFRTRNGDIHGSFLHSPSKRSKILQATLRSFWVGHLLIAK